MGPVKPRVLALAVLVAAGATIGTAIRAVVELAYPAQSGQWPWATFWINLVGSALLGILLEILARAGDDTGWRQRARLGVGTGVIGGFTTYSTYVVEIDQLARAGHPILAASYALISVVAGVLAAAAGVAVVGAVHHRSAARGAGHRFARRRGAG